MRTRTRGSPVAPLCTVTGQGYCGNSNAVVTLATVPTVKVGMQESITDVVVPNFSRRRKAGEVFFNPYSSSKITVSATAGGLHHIRSNAYSCGPEYLYFNHKASGGYGLRLVFLGGFPSPLSLYSDSDLLPYRDDVATRVRASFATGSNNLFETIAEAGKTASMLVKPLQRIQAILANFDKGVRSNTRASVKSSRQLSNEYLMYRYGIRPLMNDVEAIIAASINKRRGRARETWRARAETPTKESTVTSYVLHDYCKTTVTKTSSHFVELRGTVLGETDFNILTDFGFRSKGLFTLPIELIPYSFVGDWFLTLGDYLRSQAPSLETSWLGACMTEKHTQVTTWTIGNTVPDGTTYSVVSSVSDTARSAGITKRRYDLPDASVLSIRPDFRLTELTRAADIVALITQRLADPRIFSAWKQRSRYTE